jgi:succinylglutamic semialdehyde dehydrogenase
MTHFINNIWQEGMGEKFSSINPANGETIWTGTQATETEINAAVNSARVAFPAWSRLSMEERLSYLEDFAELVKEHKDELAQALCNDTGKAIWECAIEITSPISKLSISVDAYRDRTGSWLNAQRSTLEALVRNANKPDSIVRHKPHGVIAVFGPYNFPVHTPHGHILPALLAGNTLVFKPSELTPYISEAIMKLWQQAGLPEGVINMIQGKVETGKLLSNHSDIDGIFFTGSSRTGTILHENYAGHPGKILALEMGGNNPLIVHEVQDVKAAVYLIIQSAFITAGQRCTCARRLIMIDEAKTTQKILDLLVQTCSKIKIGDPMDASNFIGPVISATQADNLLTAQSSLISKGAKPLLEMKKLSLGDAYVSPGIIDCTDLAIADEENFGPLLKVYRVRNWDAAIAKANDTEYGLSSGLISDDEKLYEDFYQRIRAGLVNWNNQITGASSAAPFGGVGCSGNHRPSAYYAADYCAYPVSSMESPVVKLPEKLSPGISL